VTPPRQPSPDGEAVAHLAVQVTALRGQVRLLNKRLDQAGVPSGTDASPAVPAPVWVGLSDEDREAQLAGLRQWVDTILRAGYDGYQVRDCWPSHPQAVWELSTLAAQWHHIYASKRPSLDLALEFYDRWLPGTMRRLADITSRCRPECITQTRPRTQRTEPRP
jgi:hypothetical protein